MPEVNHNDDNVTSISMMQEEAVFKKPKSRRSLFSLFCKETLDDLEGVWNAPPPALINPNYFNAPLACNNALSVTGTHLLEISQFAASALIEDNEVDEIGEIGSVAQGADVDVNKYTAALWDEFNSSVVNQDSDSNLTLLTLPDPANFAEIISSKSPEIFLLRDETLFGTDSESSDVDWESLTPPVPRSPGDHVVPDQEDMYWESVCSNQDDHTVPNIELTDPQSTQFSCFFDDFPSCVSG